MDQSVTIWYIILNLFCIKLNIYIYIYIYIFMFNFIFYILNLKTSCKIIKLILFIIK